MVTGGLYLVVDPSPGEAKVLRKVKAALEGGVDILQVWNHWHEGQDQKHFIDVLCTLAHRYNVPVLINQEWSWLKNTALDGVHFDEIPEDIDNLKQDVNRSFIIGLTCGNNPEKIQWAIDHHADYISFCAMFPSASADSCEIVNHETVHNTRKKTDIPIFVSGGITPENLKSLLPLEINGIAVISGILKAADPKKAAEEYKHQLVRAKPTLL